nr:PREDICTED: embryogenesis-associated protein EMB8-like [Daucus carota subsp. sativus]
MYAWIILLEETFIIVCLNFLVTLQAENDPIAPSRGIPYEDIKGNPNCLLIVTPKGGHLGWVAGDEAPRGDPWTDPLMMDFLQNLECNAGSHTSSSNSSRPNENVHQSTDQMDPLKV